MFPQEVTSSLILMALFASCGGCAIRYIELYKSYHKVKYSFLFLDLFISAFTGFFLFWFLMEHKSCSVPQAMILLNITGFLGSKLFDLGSYVLYKKLGINIKFTNSKGEDKDDCSRE